MDCFISKLKFPKTFKDLFSQKFILVKLIFLVWISYSIIYADIASAPSNMKYEKQKMKLTDYTLLHIFLAKIYGKALIEHIHGGKFPTWDEWTQKDAALLYYVLNGSSDIEKKEALKLIKQTNYSKCSIIPYLIDLMSSQDDVVRQKSYEILKSISNKDFGYNILTWQSWYQSIPLYWNIVGLAFMLTIVIVIISYLFKSITKIYVAKHSIRLLGTVIILLFFYQMFYQPWGLSSNVIKIGNKSIYFLHWESSKLFFCSHLEFIIAKIKLFLILGYASFCAFYGFYNYFKKRKNMVNNE